MTNIFKERFLIRNPNLELTVNTLCQTKVVLYQQFSFFQVNNLDNLDIKKLPKADRARKGSDLPG